MAEPGYISLNPGHKLASAIKALPVPNYAELEFDKKLLRCDWNIKLNLLGSGHYGTVYKARYRDGSGRVAVKQSNSDSDGDDLDNELRVLAFIPAHENIVSLVGAVYDEDEPDLKVEMLILELCDCSLENYLIKKAPSDVHQLTDIALQIATGMERLASKRIVHGDLTTRNVLLTISSHRIVAKITDFGLARPKYYKLCQSNFEWPMRILPPEAIDIDKETGMFIDFAKDFELSFKSDVWAYGCLLYCLFNEGKAPHEKNLTKEHFQIRPDIRKGPAKFATEELKQVMILCWNSDSGTRISFSCLKNLLQGMVLLQTSASGTSMAANGVLQETNEIPLVESFVRDVPLERSEDVEQTGSCRCVKKCKKNYCPCKKEGRACSPYCHHNASCSNKD